MKFIQSLKRKHKEGVQKIEDKVIRIAPTEQAVIVVDEFGLCGTKLVNLKKGEKPTREQLCLLRNVQPILTSLCNMRDERDAAVLCGVSYRTANRWFNAYLENVRHVLCEVNGAPKLLSGENIDDAAHRIECINKSLASRLAVEAKHVGMDQLSV